MNIEILQLIEGAKRAKGIAVIIDVFRAFSLEAYLFDTGVEKIIPVGDSKLSYILKEENPDYILAGERNGKMLPGFDLPNSPSALKTCDYKGKTVIHTTSAGTQGIANSKNADIILGASLVNAKATAEYILKSGEENVSLVCMGLNGVEPTDEDTLCAQYIKSLLLGEEKDISKEASALRHTSGAKFFDPLQQEVFPEADFHMCIQVDKFDFAMRLFKDEGREYIKPIKNY